MFADFATAAQLAISARMKPSNSAAVPPTGSSDWASNLARVSADRTMAATLWDALHRGATHRA